jgi:hypothetical protein
MSTPGGYGMPPYGPTKGGYDPAHTITENPPITDSQDVGEFIVTTKTPPRVQAGMAAKFGAQFNHSTDGPVGGTSNPWTSGPSVQVLDGNGNVVLSANIVVGAVTAEGSVAGAYFSVIQVLSGCPPGNYVVEWYGSYTPINTMEPQVALPLRIRRQFEVKVLQAPSGHFLIDTRMM